MAGMLKCHVGHVIEIERLLRDHRYVVLPVCTSAAGTVLTGKLVPNAHL